MRRASSKEISMTFLTRDVGMICWMMIRSFRPRTDSMLWRTLPISTPRALRTLLGCRGGYLPAAIALAVPTAFWRAAEDSFILRRAWIVVAGACLGAGISLLSPGGRGLGRLRWPLVAGAGAAVLAFLFSISRPLSFAGSYTRYESLPVRIAYVGLLAMAVWLMRTKRQRDWVVTALVFGTGVACLEALLQFAQQVSYRPHGNLGNANVLGALIAMTLPLAVP